MNVPKESPIPFSAPMVRAGRAVGLIQYLETTYFSLSYLRHRLLKPEVVFNHHFSLDMILPQQPARFSLRSRMVASLDLISLEPSTPSPSYGVLGFFLPAKSLRALDIETFPRLGGGNITMIKDTIFSPCREYCFTRLQQEIFNYADKQEKTTFNDPAFGKNYLQP